MPDAQLEKGTQNPLYQQLMRRLKNDIVSGRYAAGARIPSEQALCDTYGVSRVTVRKAMLDLVQEGLLVRRQGKGTFVADARLTRDLQHITSDIVLLHRDLEFPLEPVAQMERIGTFVAMSPSNQWLKWSA